MKFYCPLDKKRHDYTEMKELCKDCNLIGCNAFNVAMKRGYTNEKKEEREDNALRVAGAPHLKISH